MLSVQRMAGPLRQRVVAHASQPTGESTEASLWPTADRHADANTANAARHEKRRATHPPAHRPLLHALLRPRLDGRTPND